MLREPNSPVSDPRVAFVGRPPLVKSKIIECMLHFCEIHYGSNASASLECHSVQADRDSIVHQSGVRDCGKFMVEHTDEAVVVFHPVAEPSKDLPVNPCRYNIVEILLDIRIGSSSSTFIVTLSSDTGQGGLNDIYDHSKRSTVKMLSRV